MGERDSHSGRFLGLPYDFRPLAKERLRKGIWDPDNPRVMVPKAWGWGYGINLHAVFRRLGLTERKSE